MGPERSNNRPTHRSVRSLIVARRDPGGRLLVPVKLNGRGPFQFILNTGAGRSAVTSETARALGSSVDEAPSILVHGVTGSTAVPTIRVESVSLGTMNIPVSPLPVLANAFHGADGFLSAASLGSECIVIDFMRSTVALPKGVALGRDRSGAATVRMDPSHAPLLTIGTHVQSVAVKTIIDTGAHATLGNLALHSALTNKAVDTSERVDLLGAVAAAQIGSPQALPMMTIGELRIFGACIAYGDLSLFEYLKLTTVPAMLLGMDILDQFASLAIDYEHEIVQFRPRTSKRS
jgi:Aspartyl protease